MDSRQPTSETEQPQDISYAKLSPFADTERRGLSDKELARYAALCDAFGDRGVTYALADID